METSSEKAKIIVEMKFGSHLYGLNTPESDTDLKGIFIPSYRDIILGTDKKVIDKSTNKTNTKNNTDDIDHELFSLKHFIKNCKEGQTWAIDMLFAPSSAITASSKEWDFIRVNKDKLLTSKATSFVGYCFQQANKYGIKGSRIKALKLVIDTISPFLSKKGVQTRLGELDPGQLVKAWNNKHIKIVEILGPNKIKAPYLEVCGRKFGMTERVPHVVEVLSKIENSYGERARKAERNEGVDFKALSHAVRVCFEAQELLTTGKVTFPFTGKRKKILMDIKQGNMHYLEVSKVIEHEMEKVKEVESKSTLPNKIDESFWEEFIFKTYSRKSDI